MNLRIDLGQEDYDRGSQPRDCMTCQSELRSNDAVDQSQGEQSLPEITCKQKEELTMPTDQNMVELDVRPIIPREKHPTIHATFETLNTGQSMTLINDHDPKPLYYEFNFEKPGRFRWEYVEQGPEVWKVVITKIA
jgi:uncharacterized protein (DUF2249 family)